MDPLPLALTGNKAISGAEDPCGGMLFASKPSRRFTLAEVP